MDKDNEPSVIEGTDRGGVETSVATTEPTDANKDVNSSVKAETLSVNKKKKAYAKWTLPVVVAGVLLLGGGAAAYITVFQKSPEKLWSRALNNTVDGLDEMIKNGIADSDKGMKLDGKLEVKSPIAIDGTMSGSWYETTGSMSADISASGARVKLDVKTIGENAESTPDIYIKASGLDEVDALTGGAIGAELGSLLSQVDDQWFFIDKTLLDQALLSADQSDMPSLSREDFEQISTKVMTVMRDRFFASDENGVFTLGEKVGKEEFEGTDSYKVKVLVNKENFKSFVTEVKDALKGTKAEELLKASDPEKSLEEAIDFEKLLKEIDDTDFSKATAEVWIEGNGGYIRNVRVFPEADNTKSYIDIGMKYEGGDLYPLTLKVTMDEEGSKGTLVLGMTVNAKNADTSVTMNADMDFDGQPFKMDMSMQIAGNNDKVSVEAPADATNVLELLSGFQSQATDSFDITTPYNYDELYDLDSSTLDDQELQ
jgi:hypothetical protein